MPLQEASMVNILMLHVRTEAIWNAFNLGFCLDAWLTWSPSANGTFLLLQGKLERLIDEPDQAINSFTIQ